MLVIKNERQYRITNAQATNLKKAVGELQGKLKGETEQENATGGRLQLSALQAQLGDLEAELREYESLRGA